MRASASRHRSYAGHLYVRYETCCLFGKRRSAETLPPRQIPELLARRTDQALDCGTDFVIVIDDTDYRHFILLPRLLTPLQLAGCSTLQDASLFTIRTRTQRFRRHSR